MQNDQGQLSGKTALITGASRGIGEAIALAMAREGAHTILTARSVSDLNSVCEVIEKQGGKASVIETDLSDRDAVLVLCLKASSVDILVNNAASPVHLFGITEVKDQEWETALAVDFWAPMILMRELGRQMKDRGSGVIINISSMVSKRKTPLSASYGVCKAALETLTEYGALELGPYGVNVNAIAPGLVATELVRNSLSPAVVKQLTRTIPMGRPGECEEVAELAVFLASGKAPYINGQTIYIDGGTTSGIFPGDGSTSE